MTPILAIDPGALGGFAWRTHEGIVYAGPMPKTPGDVLDTLTEIHATCPGMVSVMERVSGYTGGTGAPGSAMFNFGHGVGFIEGVLMTRAVSIELVTPQKWQKECQLGTHSGLSKTEWKNKLKAEAQRRFPAIKVTLGTADALLILNYAMNKIR